MHRVCLVFISAFFGSGCPQAVRQRSERPHTRRLSGPAERLPRFITSGPFWVASKGSQRNTSNCGVSPFETSVLARTGKGGEDGANSLQATCKWRKKPCKWFSAHISLTQHRQTGQFGDIYQPGLARVHVSPSKFETCCFPSPQQAPTTGPAWSIGWAGEGWEANPWPCFTRLSRHITGGSSLAQKSMQPLPAPDRSP